MSLSMSTFVKDTCPNCGENLMESNRWTKDGIKQHYYEVEGGHVNNKDDLGGETGAGGITEGLLKEYDFLWDDYNFHGDMKAVPYALTMDIFDREFWNPMFLDDIIKIHPTLADTMYQWGLNSGCTRPVKVLQRHLNVMNNKGSKYDDLVVDGFMGPTSMKLLRAYLKAFESKRGIYKLVKVLHAGQMDFYGDIAASREDNETFMDGWLNRILEVEEEAAKYPN